MPSVSAEYAAALYSLSSDENLEADILGDIRSLSLVFEENPGLVRLLSNPVIPKSERCLTVDRIFSGQVHPYVLNLMKLTVRNGRVSELPAIFDGYVSLWYRYSGITVAEVASAVPLGDDEKGRLMSALEAKYGGSVELRMTVDPSLIGGIRVMVGDDLADNTVRHRLDETERRLRQTVI